MTDKQHLTEHGFTLIEMIVVMVLVGILAAGAGLGIVTMAQGYIFSKDNAEVSEKAQLAMARISRELLECYDCNATSGNVGTFNNTIGARVIVKDGSNNIVIQSADGSSSDILMDNVSTFTMAYNSDKSITVTIRSLKQPGGIQVPDFVTTVYPRNSTF
jgi:prepilin-type N-terminal cleavage/methylation domain-containing protein